ncbi:hypothetical protein ACFRAR_22540 [Kitasatospora sp. NPDC056651]|uniref:hypothetical protein n=1 Tax=Kitasatospora sp. NPDC056651 TaxID=3345892 RepID=UPI0036B86A31
MFRRSHPTAVLLAALPLLLAGCSSAAPRAGDGDPAGSAVAPPASASSASAPLASAPSESVSAFPSGIPVLQSANDRPLPLDPYLLNPDQWVTLSGAQDKLLSRCLARFGFSENRTPIPMRRDSDAPKTRVDGHYGRQSPELMAKWGYHPEGGARPSQVAPAERTQTPSAEMRIAQTGSSDAGQMFGPGGQVIGGQTVPDHGCFGEMTQQLTGAVDGQLGDAKAAEDLKFATLKDSRDDARTREAFARWSSCMKAGGYDYPDPPAASGDPEWPKTPMPTQRELQVATADSACRSKANVVGVWYAVDFGYEEQAIKENAAAMAEAKKGLEAQLAAAAKALAG